MKLRLLPVVIAVVCSTVILFGGWFVYHSYAMENPLTNAVDHVPGVQSVQTDLSSDQATFTLKLSSDADVAAIYQKIVKDGAGIIGKRQVNLNIESNTSPELDKWWSSALFDVAQAMDTKQYAHIPQSLQEKAAQQPGLQVQTEMDDKNVYVRLNEGDHVKFVVLPRVAPQIGVWPNE